MQSNTIAVGYMLRPTALLSAVLVLGTATTARTQAWECPPEQAALAKSVAATPEEIAKGQKLAKQSCAECHGETGLGNGPAAVSMNPRPSSWRTPEFQAQSDACIFWKLSTGRGAMPPANRLSETERWQLVDFIRSLGTL